MQLQTPTQNYWVVSKVWNGQSTMQLTVEQAMGLLNAAIRFCKPNSKLYRRAAILMDDIVQNAADKEVGQ